MLPALHRPLALVSALAVTSMTGTGSDQTREKTASYQTTEKLCMPAGAQSHHTVPDSMVDPLLGQQVIVS